MTKQERYYAAICCYHNYEAKDAIAWKAESEAMQYLRDLWQHYYRLTNAQQAAFRRATGISKLDLERIP